MKLVLKAFQEQAVERLFEEQALARYEVSKARKLQAITLSSPTGSGKTVMMTALIEQILSGTDQEAPDPQATFVWLTDQPRLNEQTRRKMLATSSIGSSRLVDIDSTIDQDELAPRQVYFLNTQKLGKDKTLIERKDERTWTIWDTIANTVERRPASFYVLIDEAHRGMTESRNARNEATTIVQKFIKGSPGEIPPVPLILGISATPQRFDDLIKNQPRTRRPVDVPPEDVRASGLLKERIVLWRPQESQPSDMTMLRQATKDLREFNDRWAEYCRKENEPLVRPVMVVQVQDGQRGSLSATNLGDAYAAVLDESGPLPTEAFAHAFQEERSLSFGDHDVRYLSPPDIDEDPDVKVVFFKTGLNTGWDCPRAEVMMSFRTAKDSTAIAQLVGRMVRAPLARSVTSDTHLNSVALYLPHYDRSATKGIVDKLTKPDSDMFTPVEVDDGADVIELSRADELDVCFDAYAQLPSYTIPSSRKTSQVRRLMKLARLLATTKNGNGKPLDKEAPEKAKAVLVEALLAEYERAKSSEEFRAILEEKSQIDLVADDYEVFGEQELATRKRRVGASAENVQDLFREAGRKLGDGVHVAYWKARYEKDKSTKTVAKLEAYALIARPSGREAVERSARGLVQSWFDRQRAKIKNLDEGDQAKFNEIRKMARDPEMTPISLPISLPGKKSETTWERHMFVDEIGKFPAVFNEWETQVLEAELKRTKDRVVAWFRNDPRKDWSLCVPYGPDGGKKPMYPDFLMFRAVEGRIVVDLLDPHTSSLADAPAKAAGLAAFAAKHASEFGRIELIRVSESAILRLPLHQEEIREKVIQVKDKAHLEDLFGLQ